MPLGDVGDSPPHAEASVASVAQEAIWHASAQNRRRETDMSMSDIAVILVKGSESCQEAGARSRPRVKNATFYESEVAGGSPSITNRVVDG
jgi:hypothetical protein